MKRWIKILLLCFVPLTLISWDRASKELAKEHLKDKEPLSYLHDVLHLEYVENTGAAMSLGDGLSRTASFWLLSILPLIFLLMMYGYVARNVADMRPVKLFALVLIIAGGMGNIFDRIVFDRHVTDFMMLQFQSIHTGIFNFADVYVTAGAVLLLFNYNKKKKDNPVISEG